MQVADLVNQYHNSLNAGSKIAKKTKGVEQLVKTVSSMEKGQVFEGTVQSVKGDKVTLALSSGQTVTARLDKNVDVSEGQSLFFQVRSNEGGTVQIRPVQSEFGGNPTLLNALKNAGLPENEANLKLVNAMMKEQMPIDAQSIKDMVRTMKANPQADIETLVSMKKLDLPIDKGMITQFENYKQSEGAILKSVGELANEIPEAMKGEGISKEDVLSFENDLLDIVTPENDKLVYIKEAATQSRTAIVEDASPDAKSVTPEAITSDGKMEGQIKAQTLGEGGEAARVAVADNAAKTAVADNGEVAPRQAPAAGEKGIPVSNQSMAVVLTEREYTALNKTLNEFPEIKEQAPQLFDQNGNLRPETKGSDLLKAVTDFFAKSENITKEDVLKFIDSAPAKKIVDHLMSNAWTIEPKELTKKGTIDKLYEKIESEMQRLSESAKQTTHNELNQISNTAQGVKDNLSFIREVNQLYQYIQIPLQMSGEKTTGDLYVYTNKKQKRAAGDEITAFLHFDMEHLGSTDIAVKLAGKKLSTKFFLDDDISYGIIEENLPILEQRLSELGYNCDLEVENDSKKMNFVEDFLKQDVKTGGDIRRYSFDVRA